jgi:plastocyanin
MTPRPALSTVIAAAATAALFSAPTATAAAAAANRPPGEKVSGRPAAASVAETDRLEFRPMTVTVARAGIVEWTNPGIVDHNVTFDPYPGLTSDTMHHGDHYEIRFTAPGTYRYRCTFHPGMNGTVEVSP